MEQTTARETQLTDSFEEVARFGSDECRLNDEGSTRHSRALVVEIIFRSLILLVLHRRRCKISIGKSLTGGVGSVTKHRKAVFLHKAARTYLPVVSSASTNMTGRGWADARCWFASSPYGWPVRRLADYSKHRCADYPRLSAEDQARPLSCSTAFPSSCSQIIRTNDHKL